MELNAEISRLEKEIDARKKELAELRRKVPPQDVTDYTFATPAGDVRLSELFAGKPDLLVVHNMGRKCPYCTLWADGFNGVLPHLENRTAFVVSSPDAPAVQTEFAAGRGWKFRMVSVQASAFAKEMGFQSERGGYLPGVSSFRKTADGKVQRIAHTYFGPGDDFCSVWHFFDLLAEGVNEWEAQFKY